MALGRGIRVRRGRRPHVISLTLPYPPSVNTLYTTTRRGKALAPAHVEFRVQSRIAAYQQLPDGWTPLLGPVRVTLDAWRPRRRGDLDNVIKAALDALNGILWHDDAQVVTIVANRHDDGEARLVVRVAPA